MLQSAAKCTVELVTVKKRELDYKKLLQCVAMCCSLLQYKELRPDIQGGEDP